MAVRRSPKPLVGVRFPPPEPNRMQSMFLKLDKKHNLPFREHGEIRTRFGVNTETGFSGITYFYVSKTIEDTIFNLFPWLPQSDFLPLLMSINRSEIPPHNDDGVKVSINCYLNTANAVTRFHKIKENTDPKFFKLPNQTNGSLYDPACLEQTGEFKADTGDVYILDVTCLHSVTCGELDTRTAFVIQSPTCSYAETIELYKKFYS
jgi:hypothetical protein